MSLVPSMVSVAYDSALAIVYPQACAVCGASVESRHDGAACSSCWKTTHLFARDETLCWKCGALSVAQVREERRHSVRCGRCDTDAFTGARACGLYQGALRASILELKRQPHVARRVTTLMCDVLKRDPLNTADLIVPVPLHSARERERGFNQALVLARALSRVSHLTVDEHNLVRRVHTPMHRAGMDAKARRQSVEGAFQVRTSKRIVRRRVLLIDDVFTTGATVSACASVLKEAGVEEVFVLTVARA